MSDGSSNESDGLSPEDLNAWLTQEVRDSLKACELRVKEATAFVTDYALGRISEADAMERFARYHRRWDEALFGVYSNDELTDGDIVGKIDAVRAGSPSTRGSRPRSGWRTR